MSRRQMVHDSGLRRCKCYKGLHLGCRAPDSSGCQKRLPRHVLRSRWKTHSRVPAGHPQHHFGFCLVQWKHPTPRHHRCLLGGHSSRGRPSNGLMRRLVSHVHSRLVGCCFQTLPDHQLLVRWNLEWLKLFGWKMSHPIRDNRCFRPGLRRHCRYKQQHRRLTSDHCWGCNRTLPFHSFATLRCSSDSFSSSTGKSR